MCFDNDAAMFCQLPWKTMCQGARLGLEEHENVKTGWGGLSLLTIDDIETMLLFVAIEIQHLPMQTPAPI